MRNSIAVLTVLTIILAVVLGMSKHGAGPNATAPAEDAVAFASRISASPPDMSSLLASPAHKPALPARPGLVATLRPSLDNGRVQSYLVALAEADPAGLRDGDIILSVGNQPLSDFQTVGSVKELLKIGDDVVVRRNGKERRFAYGYPVGD